MTIPSDLRYTESHEWARQEPDQTLAVGITHHAQDLLGDLVFVDLPAVGRKVKKGETVGVVESVKAASDIYAPVSGEVVAVNEALSREPQRINEDAYQAWMYRLKATNPTELNGLLDAAGYRQVVESDAH